MERSKVVDLLERSKASRILNMNTHEQVRRKIKNIHPFWGTFGPKGEKRKRDFDDYRSLHVIEMDENDVRRLPSLDPSLGCSKI